MQEQFAASARELKIPQFFQTTTPSLFVQSHEFLECKSLSRDFKLAQQDARITLSLKLDDAYKIALERQGDDYLPRYKRVSLEERRALDGWLKALPPESQLNQCASAVATELSRDKGYAYADALEYVRRVLDGLSADELNCLVELRETLTSEIKRKIERLETSYRRETFRRRLAGGQIFCEDCYSLPVSVASTRNAVSIPKSLYAVEGDMNPFERRACDALANLDNVRWWHRNVPKREFRLNGWINHYPDFIVQTRAGHVVLVETKGDDRDNSDSRNKLDLGNKWKSLAGDRYRYFMVFDNNPLDDAFSLNEFLNVMQSL